MNNKRRKKKVEKNRSSILVWDYNSSILESKEKITRISQL